ncbi:BAG family molecular chaperone regulator 6-like [Phoenix dactylifera]|uniref:BAG family molecular chaperone regulator 6-like n=1 Tax=Phoenix dactylifera TaxID=42345 RepID=A0A8B7CA63_PHODC|nr:BAG family molecular chaperone regulator 6-like [Phoenix dactylifera]
MFPACRYMDPYPQNFPHRIPYPYHYYPNWEAVPPQMRVDSSKPPSPFGPWPYNGSTSHPNPTECHSCCNHIYSPGHCSFRPLYPHIQPPPHCYYSGPYLAYPDACPPYFMPPPHYSFDQARYDYEEAKNHCCGCPNHKCGGENTSVKIEEQKPDLEPKPKEGDSSNLVKLPNYPFYPPAWAPHNYLKEKDTDKNSEAQPGIWNGWIPLDINSRMGLMQNGDDKKGSQNEERRSQFPWPIMWMPGYNKPEEAVKDLKEINNGPKVSEETPKFKIIPLKFLENGNRQEKAGVAEDEPKTRAQQEAVSEKEAKTKTIPVKQMEASSQMRDEKQNEKSDEKKSIISEKQNEDCGVKKSLDGKQSSPVKLSKLTPVCLRVDPLPRRKNGNSASRSPSPPGLIEKERTHQDNKEHGSTWKEAKEEIPKKEIRIVDVKEKTSNKVGKEVWSSQDSVPIISMKGAPGKAVTENAKGVEMNDSEGGLSDDQEKKIEESRAMEDAEITKTEVRKERKNLAESDAAVLIQSAYRGFEVRRWQPLEKLRKVAQIRQQVEDIKKQIQSFETSSEGQDMKQKVVIGETIMNLLLQLDTIQGLHQSVREARKSVARELICLQEKLDSLSRQTTADHESAKIEESASSKASDDHTCLGRSVAVAEPSAEHVCEQLSDKKCTSDFTSSEEMQEAEEEDKRDALENQEVEAVPGEAAHLLNEEMVSVANGEHEEAPLRGEEQTVSEGGALVGSKLLSEEPSLELEEPLVPLVSTIKKVQEVPSAKDEAPKLDLEEHLEMQGLSCREFESANKEFCDYGARPNTQVNLEVENSLVLKGCNLGEADEIKVEEHDAVSNAVEFVEPLPGMAESNFEGKDAISEADRKQEELQMLPLAEESDSKEKTAGDATADSKSVEVPSTLHVTNAVDFLETIPGVSESNFAEAPGARFSQAETKEEEPHMLLAEEENCFAEKAIGDAAADTINMEATCARPVTLASEEGNDVGSVVEKNLEMPEDQIAVQVRSSESGMENGTKLAAANKVLEDTDMPSAPETLQEATMDKDTTSSLEQILHRESSHMSLVEAAPDEASTPAPKEEGIAVVQPKDSIPMAGPISSTNMSMEEKQLMEENEKLREMLEKLLLAGKVQLGVISDLNGRVKDLEKKLTQKKRVKVRRHKPGKSSPRKVAC